MIEVRGVFISCDTFVISSVFSLSLFSLSSIALDNPPAMSFTSSAISCISFESSFSSKSISVFPLYNSCIDSLTFANDLTVFDKYLNVNTYKAIDKTNPINPSDHRIAKHIKLAIINNIKHNTSFLVTFKSLIKLTIFIYAQYINVVFIKVCVFNLFTIVSKNNIQAK